MSEEELNYNEDEQEENVQHQEAVKTGGNYAGMHISNFKDMVLRPEILSAITEAGFESPSEVQHQCIPPALLGRDIICQAKSGMGKTAVFVLSTLHLLNTALENQVQALVVCNTRELAFQIHKEYLRFSKHIPGIKIEVFLGGLPIDPQIKILKKNVPQIVVGTPGRLLELVGNKNLDVTKVKYFVVDECDTILKNIKMRKDVQEIFCKTPRDRQVMMFSATLDAGVRETCKLFCKNAEEIFVDDDTKLILHGLKQYYVNVTEREKNTKLMDLLDSLQFNQVIIFVSEPSRATLLSKLLSSNGFPAIYIHGRMKQEDRIARFHDFKAKDVSSRILVSTDLFGRGIDVEHVNVVINYDFPPNSDQYLHRVARAGRFGTKGLAISFISDEAKEGATTDAQTFEEVQNRFHATVPPLPDQIDSSSYTM